MKNKEIERKFLVNKKSLPNLSKRDYQEITQGYMQGMGGDHFYRLRQVVNMSPVTGGLGDQYFQTIKGKGSKIRDEYESALLKGQFSTFWPLCKNITITKKRYEIPLDGHNKATAYLDVYKNVFQGLYTVEVEFKTEEECDSFNPPDWFGREVTEIFGYTNYSLALDGLPEDFQDAKVKKPDAFFDVVNNLIEIYEETVCWGGNNPKFWPAGYPTKKDVVVFQRGVRGGADWFAVNKDGLLEHRGYTSYKDTYTLIEFTEHVKRINEINENWVDKLIEVEVDKNK